MIENKEEEVIIEVNRQDYLIAIQANLDQLPIICNGSLIEENEQLIVREVQKFSILRK